MKKIIIATSLFVTLLVGCILTFVYFKNQEISVTTKVNDRKLNIALVNEDIGGTLNKKTYNFGNDFTSLLSKDTTSQWTVMSRNIAENRFDNGSVDVIVYIEQQFSDKIVQLESFNPDKAKVTYRTKSNLDPVKAKNVELRVGEYLNSINQNIVKMYFSSVVNNLDDAKRNVENIVNEQAGTHTKIFQYIYSPSNIAAQSIVGTLDFASSLQKNNATFEDAQKTFSDSVVSLLNNTGTNLDKQLTEVKSYFDLQKEISEKNVLTTNQTLKAQHEESSKIVEGLNNEVAQVLQQFGGTNSDNKQSEQQQLKELVEKYNTKVSEYRDKLADRKVEFEKLKVELEKEQESVSLYYFGKNKVDLASDLTSDAKTTLAGQIDSSLKKENHLPDSFKKMISNTLAGANVNPESYSSLFAKLKEMGALTDAQIANYTSEMNLLQGYVKFVEEIPTSTSQNFEFLNVENDKLEPISGTIPITVQLPHAEVKNTTTASSSTSESATTNSSKQVEKELVSPQQKISPKATVSISKDEGDFSVSLNGGNQEISDAVPHQLSIAYSLNPKYGKNTISFKLHIGNTTIPITKTFYFSDKEQTDALVKKDLTNILGQLGKIDRASAMVQSIYGTPEQVGNTVNFGSISPDSVYNMYGNISRDNIISQLSSEQVEKFKKSGIDLLTSIHSSLESFAQTLNAMPEITDSELPNQYFESKMTDLTTWYNSAIRILETEYDKWKATKAKQLEVTSYNTKNNEATLLNDGEASSRLYSSIESLVQTTTTNSKETTRSHEAVGTMKTQFDQFVNQVHSIKENVDKTITTTNELVSSEASVIQENRLYSNSFKDTMKNARDGGKTNQNVLNFLSKPIETKKETKAVPISTSNNSLWIVLAVLISSIISISITYWLTKTSIKHH